MRIDTSLAIQPSFTMPAAPLGEGGTAFEALLPPSPAAQASADVKAGRPWKTFGFDTLGVLGAGGPAGAGHPTKPGETKSAHDAPDGQVQSAPQTIPAGPGEPRSVPPAMPAGAVQSQTPVSSGDEGENGPAPVAKADHVTPRLDRPGYQLMAGATPTGFEMAPRAASTIALVPGRDISSTNESPLFRTIVSGDEPLATEAAEDIAKSPETSQPFRSEVETEAPSGSISLTLSEVGGILNVTAAAPDLAQNDRSVLRKMTEDAAAEAGVPLGELRLNGVVIPKFSKIR